MFFKNQNLFFGAGDSWNRAYTDGPGAEFFHLEPEPKKNIWSRSRGKMVRLSNTAN